MPGNNSGGMVGKADFHPRKMGALAVVSYGSFITSANNSMSDGSALDGNAVLLDEFILPTAKDVAGGMDPVLARATQFAGIRLHSESAGHWFPQEKQRENITIANRVEESARQISSIPSQFD